MNTKYEMTSFGPDVVYVKAVDVADLPPEVREKVGDMDQLFAVHDVEGTQLALVADRRLAFALARQHDKVPYTVH